MERKVSFVLFYRSKMLLACFFACLCFSFFAIPKISLASYAGEYWNIAKSASPTFPTGTPTYTRTDSDINFNWGESSPRPGTINIDGFTARWTETKTFSAGTYYFTTSSDDGIRVYIDGTLFMDHWIDQGTTSYNATRSITAGSHTIKVEYYENAGGAVCQFSYYKMNPSISSVTPSDNATGISPTTELIINFDQTVYTNSSGSNDVIIKKSSDGSTIETIDAKDAKVSGTGSTSITIDPATILSEQTSYYIQIGADAFYNGSSYYYSGISDATTWNFTTGDFTNPTISTFTPADDATGIAVDSDLVIRFSESVDVGTGNIKIKKSSDNSTFETIDVSGSKATGSGTDTITINPSADLGENTSYYIQVDATAFDDVSGNSFAGISNTTSWNFKSYDSNTPINDGSTQEKFDRDVDSGFIAIDGGDSSSTDKVTFTTDYTIKDGDIKVVIPEDTEMTSSEGGTINFTDMSLEDITDNIRNAYVGNIAGAVSIGIPSLKLSFSKNITVTIPVGSSYNGQTLNVYYQNEGETDWNGGLSCAVASGLCVFETDHATKYSAGDEPASGDSDDEEEDVEVKDVEYSSNSNSITIAWKTDIKADSKVKYGKKKNNLNEKKDEKKKEKEHKMVIKDLDSDTKYFFKVCSKKGDEKDSSKTYSIRTAGAPPVSKSVEVDKNENNEKEKKNYSGDAKPNVCSYEIQDGDNLWIIAKKIYGDATAYPLIIKNNENKYPKIKNFKLKIGDKLVFCEEAGSVEGASDEKNPEIETVGEKEKTETNWWNPLDWF